MSASWNLPPVIYCAQRGSGTTTAKPIRKARRDKETSAKPWTKDLWMYDLRTNQHFTLKTNPLANKDLEDFKAVSQPGKVAKRKNGERFKKFTYDEIVARDKANLDISCLKSESLDDTENLRVLASEIVKSLEAALEQIRGVGDALLNTAND